MRPILCLDMATTTGFAHGAPGAERPFTGSIRFAPPGASHGEISAAMIRWLSDLLKVVEPASVWIEAPQSANRMAGRTTASTLRLLAGLPFAAEGVCHLFGVYSIWEAEASDVRRHFLQANPARDSAKRMTVAKCRALGWEVADDNAADAAALWSYASAKILPKTALRATPLFRGNPS